MFLGLIITSNSMSYEEANYEVVKKNEVYEIRKYSDRLAIETDISNDSTQIIYRILNKCNIILKDCINCKNLQNFDLETFNVLETGINLCTNYVNDYFELPYVYEGDNYVLNFVILNQ